MHKYTRTYVYLDTQQHYDTYLSITLNLLNLIFKTKQNFNQNVLFNKTVKFIYSNEWDRKSITIVKLILSIMFVFRLLFLARTINGLLKLFTFILIRFWCRISYNLLVKSFQTFKIHLDFRY